MVEMIELSRLNCDLNVLCKARNKLSHEDYVKIWGKQLGDHIWRQDGSDLLKIWTSGLTTEQKKQFLIYILEMKLE